MSVYSSHFHLSYFYGATSNESNLSKQSYSTYVHVYRAVGCSRLEADIRVTNLALSNRCNAFLVKSYNNESTRTLSISDDDGDLEDSGDGNVKFPPENGNSGGGGGGSGGGSGGDGDYEGGDEDEKEFGPILNFEEVIRETEKHGVTLPSDILEAAKTTGIRELILMRYLELQVNFVTLLFFCFPFVMIYN